MLFRNSFSPSTTSSLPATEASLGGALLARMKRVKDSTSTPNGCTVLLGSFGSTVLSSGSGTLSNIDTSRPLEVFSWGCSGLVMPISLM